MFVKYICRPSDQCILKLNLHKYILILFDMAIIVFNIFCIFKYRFKDPQNCKNNPSWSLYCAFSMLYAFSIKIYNCCYIISFIPLTIGILWSIYIFVDSDSKCKTSYLTEMPEL